RPHCRSAFRRESFLCKGKVKRFAPEGAPTGMAMTEYEKDHESPREELANAISHGLGALAALAGGSVLITLSAAFGNGWQLAGAIVFSASLFLLYLASTLYH